MRLLRLLSRITIALALASGSAQGGAKPRIEKVEPEKSMPGGVIKVTGTNFAEKIEDVEVLFNGTKCTVVEVLPTSLTFSLPTEVSKGKHSFTVAIAGEKSDKVDITILSEADRAEKAAEDKRRMEGDGATQAKYLDLDPPQAMYDRGSLIVTAAGKADYPDGALIVLQLNLDNKNISRLQQRVAGGTFRGNFGPFQQQLFAGNYMVVATFDLSGQPGEIRRAFKTSITDPKKQAEMRQASDREYVAVGSSADIQFQAKELRDHFANGVARTRALLRDLDNAYAAAARSLYRTRDGKVDEEEWQTFVAKRIFRNAVPDEERSARFAEMKKNAAHLNADATFNDAAWREWLDFKWREDGIVKLIREHIQYRDRYIVIRNPEEIERLTETLGLLLALSQHRSRDLYSKNGLPNHASDAQTKGVDVASLGTIMATPSAGAVEGNLKKIERNVGLLDESAEK